MNIPESPIQLLAVTENSAYGGSYCSELEAKLIAEGSNLADRLNAHFMTSTSALQQKCGNEKPSRHCSRIVDRKLMSDFLFSFLLHTFLQRSVREEI